MDEMGVAGALAGEPIRTVKCLTVDLDVPADSEIVIEGLVDPELLEPEGPFGESHGYIALEDFNMSMQVTAITHKKKPVFVSIISQVTQGAPRSEVWRALHGASGLRADCGKIVVAVSDDIDPTNTDAVWWSIAYRANPVEDVHVVPHRAGGHGPKAGR